MLASLREFATGATWLTVSREYHDLRVIKICQHKKERTACNKYIIIILLNSGKCARAGLGDWKVSVSTSIQPYKQDLCQGCLTSYINNKVRGGCEAHNSGPQSGWKHFSCINVRCAYQQSICNVSLESILHANSKGEAHKMR